ncbi:MAG: hypothetical protein L0220_13655 [Acidobacteria bacterium]|nr:hypothetical protein [Acidobacteriota bacterium]
MRRPMGLFRASIGFGVLVFAAGIGVVAAVMQDEEKRAILILSPIATPIASPPQEPGTVVPRQPLLLPMPGGGLSWHGGTAGVKDSPFSAELVFENIQTLTDGNRIVHRTTTTIYRDGQGRTRQETTYKLPGISNDENKERKTIQISDPVAGNTYTIDPHNRTVHKFVNFARPILRDNSAVGAAAGIAFNVGVPLAGNSTIGSPGGGNTPKSGIPAGTATASASVTSGAPQLSRASRFSVNMETKSETLGTEMVEGIAAEGTRVTHTIPAGSVGNERPIDIIIEQWFSQELKMEVLVKNLDPRRGETIQRLTNINRGEPDPSLFEVPSDYTVQEMRPPVLGRDEADRIKLLRERGKSNDQ